MDCQWNGISVRLLRMDARHDDLPIGRAGVVPFSSGRGEDVEFLFMTPHHKPGYSAPKDQIAKGGRLVRRGGAWVELDDRNAQSLEGLELEACIDTAMREGREELGLLPDNVARLYDLGPVRFQSEKKKSPASMYLFAAQVKSKEHFEDVLSQTPSPVARVRWMTLEQFLREGREDHRPIVGKIWESLKENV